MFFVFNREVAREICAVYGEEKCLILPPPTIDFRNFNLIDESRSGTPNEIDEERLDELVKVNLQQTRRDLAEKTNYDKQIVLNHLHSMRKVQKLGSWMLHVLSVANKNQRCTIAGSLLARHRSTCGNKQCFLYRIVTGNERRWCLYANFKRRKEWLNPEEQVQPV